MTSRAFRVVEMFEEAMCEYTGAPYAVATESCSMAILLSLMWVDVHNVQVAIPAKTYISVPAAILHAGGDPAFVHRDWEGAYWLGQTGVHDAALRMRKGMYEGGLQCVSFHARKHLKIGRGGMVLTEHKDAAEAIRKARFDGRTGSIPFMHDDVAALGWNGYMLPEQAARGLQLLEALPDDNPDLTPDYPDLSKLKVFTPFMVVSP